MVAPSTGAGYTYSWLPVGSTNDSIIVNPQLIDTIILQTIPPSGCGFYSVFILAPTIINTSLSYSVNCNQVTFIDSTTIQGGTISGWNWQFPGGSPASSTSPTPPVVTYPPGTYTASLTVISQAGCTDTTAYTSFTVNPPLPITVNSVAICANITDTLCASSGFSSYLWTPSGQTSSCIIVSSASVPTYTVTGTAANGCTNTAIASVSILPNPSITTSVTAAGCTVLSGTATASVTVITPPYSYVWNTSPPQNTQTATGLASGQYIVQVTNGNGCTSTATVTVPMSGPPTVSAGNAASICPGQTTANISASSVPAGVSYAWSPSAGLSCATCQTTTASPAFTVTYFVTVTDVNGCTNTASVPIVVGALPYVSAIAGYTVCTGGTVPLSANENNILPTSAQWPLQWNWYPPNSPPLNSDTLEDPTITPNTTTNLYVVVTDAFGCKDTAYATVYVETIPSVSLTDWTPYITCEGYVIPFLADVSANGGSAYWDFGDNSNFTDYQPVPPPIDPWPSTPTPHIYNFGGTYTVSVVAINSICRDTIDTTFTVNDQGKYLNILPANVFTTNGDMYNECFRPALDITNVPNITNPDSLKATLVQCIELEVWDRWGIKLFESTETVKCWNGKTKQGTPAKAGTYYYIARFKDVIINGFVELLR